MAVAKRRAANGTYDCTYLDNVDEEGLVENLRVRFELGKMYTYMRDMMISVNPYQKLGFYTNDFIAEYKSTDLFSRPPHIYAVADSAFHGMVLFRKDTCIIISGESGSGKTVASKYLTQYITTLALHSPTTRVKNQLVVSGPLLESFGNARTVRNNNASRFGKYLSVVFNLDIQPKGGLVKTYLLEKDRVVRQQDGERNFHCFYQLLAGVGERLMEELQLEKDPRKYRYLGGSSNLTTTDANLYEDVLKAMMTLRFTKEDIENIRNLLAAILHLGNVEMLKLGDSDLATISNLNQLTKVAKLLGTQAESLVKVLTRGTASAKVNNDVIETKLGVHQAVSTRDKLTKTLYERLFQLIVSRVNRALSVADTLTTSVSILDFYGFEAFETNSFEQFCINYCNERLQQLFISVVLKREQELYQSEGLMWEMVDFDNNEPTCRVMESILTVMADECQRPSERRNSKDILKQFDEAFSASKVYSSHTSGSSQLTSYEHFQIKHYAGCVKYNVRDFMDKNKDTESEDLNRMLLNCQLPILKEMFPEEAKTVTVATSGATTVGERMKSEMSQLIEQLENQTPHWIRCIVPNTEKSPNEWNHDLVLNQVRSLGLVQTAKVFKAGCVGSMDYERFMWRYKMTDEAIWPVNNLSAKEATKKVISTYKLRDVVVMGKTKIFFKSKKTVFLLEAERQKRLPEMGMIVYRSIKGHYDRQMGQRIKALMTMVISYRRKFVGSWFAEVVRRFKDCVTTPDYGRSIKWPKPPPAMKLAERLLKRVHLCWWAKMRLSHYSPSQQYKLRLKTIAYEYLHGNKPNLQLGEKWLGDELGNKELNSRAAQFVEAMTAYQNLYGDKKRLYSCLVTKLNRRLKSNSRVFVLCDKHLYRLTNDYKLAKTGLIELEMVTGVSISTGCDQAIVLHCVRRLGDCVFYLENNRPASEFLATICHLFRRKYKRRLPVKVTDAMKFARPNDGIEVGNIQPDNTSRPRRAKSPSFKKLSSSQVSIAWPDTGIY